ncbi:MAG: ABC transporter ATP-binding protein [Lachnospiraceae bacterium]|nr:ABC transporter ATP-binding protein [Lachnospiraceae bacterium]
MITSEWYKAILYVFGSAAIFMLGKKASMKKNWLSFVPFIRYVHVGRIADREKEGRVVIGMSILLRILMVSIEHIDVNDEIDHYIAVQGKVNGLSADMRLVLLLSVMILAVTIALVIYYIRLYLGICKRFDAKWGWALLMVPAESLVFLLFALHPKFKYHPVEEETEEGAGVSGAKARVLQSGLTIDITERKVKDGMKERRLLRDIHLSIPRGHMVLLLGGSGAGKTTFLNAVTGYEQADATILLDGKDIYKDYEMMKFDVGFVPQQDLMRSNDTVLRTLSDTGALRLPDNMNAAARRKRVQEVLESFGLAMLADTLVEKLSGGQRKRLSIAMEFISDPGLFILDEPDSGLDGVVARGLFEKLRAIADEGRIVIVITHTPDRVIDLFDDVIVLAKDVDRTGRLAYYGPVKEAGEFFGKDGMEQILLSINQKEEGGEGRANEFVARYAQQIGDKTEEGKAGM